MIKEIYKNIKGYEDSYQISNLGNVKSLRRLVVNSNNVSYVLKEKILKEGSDGGGYKYVILRKNNKSYNVKIHKLVALSFLNHTPSGQRVVIDHIDNNKANNRLNNLQIISQRENSSKDKKNGTSKYVGVSWKTREKKWRASIRDKGKRYDLGLFKTEYEAHLRYQEKLLEIKNPLN